MKLIETISLKSTIKYTSITVAICATVIGATILMTNLSFPEERGQGGYDATSSTINEKEFLNDVASTGNDLTTSEIPFESSKSKKSFEESVAASNNKQESAALLEESTEFNLSYISYRVKAKDIIGNIAQEFNVTSDSILSLNNINNARGLQIGQYLKIPTMSGILYTTKKVDESIKTIAEKYNVDSEKFASVNHVSVDKSFAVGTTLFIPDAKMDWATVQEINGDLFKKPIKAKWYKSSSFGWRSSPFTGTRSYHSGIDMACPTGTTIYAALAGTVTSTGYSSTYGNYVIITHHSGYKTLYGHMSAILCVKGQHVNQNTRIGKVGSTGLSTGPHLHFTVYKNNAAVNPAILWN